MSDNTTKINLFLLYPKKNSNLVALYLLKRTIMKKNISLLMLFLVVITTHAQHRYMVSFKDKGQLSTVNIEDVLSPRAIKNHQKNKVVFNELDFPEN